MSRGRPSSSSWGVEAWNLGSFWRGLPLSFPCSLQACHSCLSLQPCPCQRFCLLPPLSSCHPWWVSGRHYCRPHWRPHPPAWLCGAASSAAWPGHRSSWRWDHRRTWRVTDVSTPFLLPCDERNPAVYCCTRQGTAGMREYDGEGALW